MDWLTIGSAVLVGFMLVMLLPHARRMIKESRKGTPADWMGVLIPLALVVLFVIFLMSLV